MSKAPIFRELCVNSMVGLLIVIYSLVWDVWVCKCWLMMQVDHIYQLVMVMSVHYSQCSRVPFVLLSATIVQIHLSRLKRIFILVCLRWQMLNCRHFLESVGSTINTLWLLALKLMVLWLQYPTCKIRFVQPLVNRFCRNWVP